MLIDADFLAQSLRSQGLKCSKTFNRPTTDRLVFNRLQISRAPFEGSCDLRGQYSFCSTANFGPVLARTEWDAPEIDGSVIVDESLPVGQFANITIGDWRGYDLVAAR